MIWGRLGAALILAPLPRWIVMPVMVARSLLWPATHVYPVCLGERFNGMVEHSALSIDTLLSTSRLTRWLDAAAD